MRLTELPGQILVPPVEFPKRESAQNTCPRLWIYANGPGSGGKPVTFLRIERTRVRGPEPFGLMEYPKPETRCVTTIAFLDVVEIAQSPEKQPNKQAAITGQIRRIKTGVCLRRLHDTGSCFATRDPLAAGRAVFGRRIDAVSTKING